VWAIRELPLRVSEISFYCLGISLMVHTDLQRSCTNVDER